MALKNPFIGSDEATKVIIERVMREAGCTDSLIAATKRGNEGALKKCVEAMQVAYLSGLQRIAARDGADAAVKIHSLGQRVSNGELERRLDAGESIEQALSHMVR